MQLRQNGINKESKHVIFHWKSYFSGNEKSHVVKTENIVLSSYSAPLQRHSPLNIEFLESFHCILKENICLYTSVISTIFV